MDAVSGLDDAEAVVDYAVLVVVVLSCEDWL